MFPPGSLLNPDKLVCPPSPSTPFEFPFNESSRYDCATMYPGHPPGLPLVMDSVIYVVDIPRVCGLSGHSTSDGTATLVDSGANICVIGLIESLVDVTTIPPLPISVAVHGSDVSLDDCCTHRGLLPLTMEDGSILPTLLLLPEYC